MRSVNIPTPPSPQAGAPSSPIGARHAPGADFGAEPGGARPQGWNPPPPRFEPPPLRRATGASTDLATPWMAGVCSGIAAHTGMRVGAVRWIFLLLAFFGGAGLLLYLWLWVMVPKDAGERIESGGAPLSRGLETSDPKRMRVAVRNQLFGAGLLLIAFALGIALLSSSGVASLRDLASTLSIVLGIGLVWSQGGNLDHWRSARFLASVALGVLLLSIGILALVAGGDPPIILLRGGLIGAVIAAGVLFALAPLWLRTSKDLSASQAQQVRDAERADIAAHLHDSVLQTLTLIRASAEDPRRVRALALSEERELRSWLYTGRSEAASSLAEAVRETVGAVESKYGVPVEVVTVSDAEPGPSELALVAALGEAVANAVRHGSPPVSVYLEAHPHRIEAYIKDSGGGFDITAIPPDRHGVRDSIIGRMERVGGSANIRIRPSGTEIALDLPRNPDGSRSAVPTPQGAS